MKSSLNILIGKDDSGYVASCSQIEGYQVTTKSLDIVVNNLKITIKNYLQQSTFNIEKKAINLFGK